MSHRPRASRTATLRLLPLFLVLAFATPVPAQDDLNQQLWDAARKGDAAAV
ncbi:MAG: hypothetical protein ACRD9R_14220 [Pyrinomonadaceae bacterium]